MIFFGDFGSTINSDCCCFHGLALPSHKAHPTGAPYFEGARDSLSWTFSSNTAKKGRLELPIKRYLKNSIQFDDF
jgi:hypothetical protein